MKKIFAIFVMCTGLVNQIVADIPTKASISDPWEAAERELSQFFPKLHALGYKYPNDVEIQLGLVSLYTRPGASAEYSPEDQIEKVLAIDPNNKAAWAIQAKLICRRYTAKRRDLLDQLKSVIANARERNAEELRPYKDSDLYRCFKEEGKDTVVIKDFDLAVQQLRQKLDEKASAVLATLNKGNKQDPDNSMYNYLKAHLYFELGEQNKALREIENAVAKRHLNNYVKEKRNATARVLREVGFPDHKRPFIEDQHSPFADFIRAEIWEKVLEVLAKGYEAQGAFENAGKMYQLTLRVAKQIREEPLPYASYFNVDFSHKLQALADDRLEELHKKMLNQRDKMSAQEKKILGQSFLERAKYIIIVGLCGILIISFILLLKKKSSSRGK